MPCAQVGDKEKFNTLLVTLQAQGATGELPGTDQLAGSALAVVPGITTISAARASSEFRQHIEAAITATNNNSCASARLLTAAPGTRIQRMRTT